MTSLLLRLHHYLFLKNICAYQKDRWTRFSAHRHPYVAKTATIARRSSGGIRTIPNGALLQTDLSRRESRPVAATICRSAT